MRSKPLLSRAPPGRQSCVSTSEGTPLSSSCQTVSGPLNVRVNAGSARNAAVANKWRKSRRRSPARFVVGGKTLSNSQNAEMVHPRCCPNTTCWPSMKIALKWASISISGVGPGHSLHAGNMGHGRQEP